ncbi:hypothetical protein EDB87DRAFT_831568 [Lactarius vividus]|nr:hypothetical protein EDB87DRAFT_831568 [Lactarius vividus]
MIISMGGDDFGELGIGRLGTENGKALPFHIINIGFTYIVGPEAHGLSITNITAGPHPAARRKQAAYRRLGHRPPRSARTPLRSIRANITISLLTRRNIFFHRRATQSRAPRAHWKSAFSACEKPVFTRPTCTTDSISSVPMTFELKPGPWGCSRSVYTFTNP